jgi:hypothetical protein
MSVSEGEAICKVFILAIEAICFDDYSWSEFAGDREDPSPARREALSAWFRAIEVKSK